MPQNLLSSSQFPLRVRWTSLRLFQQVRTLNTKVGPTFAVLAIAVIALTNPVVAIVRDFEEGKHYKVVQRQSTAEAKSTATTGDKDAESEKPNADTSEISVVEYFSYGCSHCYRLEFFIEGWLGTKDEDVIFSRVAVPSRDDWVPYARAYYIAEVLGITEKVHSLLFRAIYVNKQPMGQEEPLKRMFVNVADVDPEKFDEVFESQEIPTLVQNAILEMRDFGISATPTVVVDDRYLITPKTAGDLGLMFEVVKFLVAKVKEERATKESSVSDKPAS